MSFFTGTQNLYEARASAIAGRTPTRADMLGKRYQPFSNPFFDHASTYLPADIRSLFRYCRYYYMTHGVVNAICTRASEYSVTDLIIQHEGSGVQDRWEELLLGSMNYRTLQFEINLDYSTFGNSFVSVSFPFRKMVKCASCHSEHDALDTRAFWRYTNHKFWLTCPTCSTVGFAESRDMYLSNPADITLVRWSPELINIHHNEATGRMDYTLQISPQIQTQVQMGRKDIVATLPEIFLQAVKEKAAVVFDPREIFHMRRPSLSSGNRGWGIPMIMPVLKDAFYMQIMKKAQECVHPDTLLDTQRGLILAKDVTEGTLLRTHKGTYEPVTAVRVRPMVPMRGDHSVSIQTADMLALPSTVSNNHPIYALCQEDETPLSVAEGEDISRNPRHSCKLDWVHAERLSPGDYIGFPISRIREPQVLDITDPCGPAQYAAGRVNVTKGLAYLAGRALGGGSFVARDAISFPTWGSNDEADIVSSIQVSFPDSFSVEKLPWDQGFEQKKLVVRSSSLRTFIERWLPDGKVPTNIQEAPDTVVAGFLLGYTQGCGATYRGSAHSGVTRVSARNRDLAYTIWRLALSLRCIGTVKEAAGLRGEGGYTVTWSRESNTRLLALMDGEVPCDVRGDSDGFFFHDHYLSRVKHIDHGQCPEVVSIEVANEHTFCVPGIATHNSILLEHIVPQNFIYPQPAAQGVDPFSSVDLSQWRDKVRVELARQRMDPAYTAIVPFPIGHQSIGGQGRSLLLMPEIQQVAEHIAVGMGFIPDLVFGNGNYAGSSVSMRMLENFFLSNVQSQHRLLHWAIKRIGAFLGWPTPEAKFKPFRMADDLQRLQMNFQLNQAGKLSDTTLLSASDFDIEAESKMMSKEVGLRAEGVRKQQILSAEIMGDVQVIQAKAQARAEIAMASTRDLEMAKHERAQAESAPPQLQQIVGSNILGPGGMSLDQAAMAENLLSGGGNGGGNPIDMRPMPEVLPPRRTG